MDDTVATFTAFTGASPEIARRYLGMTENNPEQAIQLFFDSPDLASGMDRPSELSQPSEPRAPSIPRSSHPQPRATSAGRQVSQGVVHVDSDDDADMDIDDDDGEQSAARAAAAAADIEDDEAMARRMQEELYAGGDSSAGYDADGVRAPLSRTTETLVGGPDTALPDDMQARLADHLRARQQARSSGMDMKSSMKPFFILSANIYRPSRCFQPTPRSIYLGRVTRSRCSPPRLISGHRRSIRTLVESCSSRGTLQTTF